VLGHRQHLHRHGQCGHLGDRELHREPADHLRADGHPGWHRNGIGCQCGWEDFLRQRVLVGTQLFVLAAQPVPVYASASVRLLTGADSVATARGVQQALANYLWPLPPGGPDGGGWPLGRTVAPDELLTQAGRVAGVLAADQLVLYAQTDSGWSPVANLPLRPWQVPALQGVGVSTDGSPPPAPAATAGSGPGGGGTLVPYVPAQC